MSDLCQIYQLFIDDISLILSAFSNFSKKTTFVCKNRVEMARHPKYRRYIVDIFVHAKNPFALNDMHINNTWY